MAEIVLTDAHRRAMDAARAHGTIRIRGGFGGKPGAVLPGVTAANPATFQPRRIIEELVAAGVLRFGNAFNAYELTPGGETVWNDLAKLDQTAAQAKEAAPPTDADRLAKAQRDLADLALMVASLSHALRRAKPDSTLPDRAAGLLKRKGLAPSPLRSPAA